MEEISPIENDIPKSLLVQYQEVRAGERFVLKVGGEIFLPENEKKLHRLAEVLAFLYRNRVNVVLVHGAGPQISKSLSDGDRTGGRITPPEKISEIRSIVMEISEKIRSKIKEVGIAEDPDILRHHFLTSSQRSSDNVTADINDLPDDLARFCGKHRVVITGHIGFDEETKSATNINADAVAEKVALKIGAQKLFFIGNTNGVLAEDGETTVPFINSRDLIPEKYEGGMGIKMEKAKRVAEAGVSVHLVSWAHLADIVRESFLPGGQPDRCTMVAKEEGRDKFKELKPARLFVEQLHKLLAHTPKILPKKVDEIVENAKNWILLVQDRVIKGACEIREHKEGDFWELGAFAVPELFRDQAIGQKVLGEFERRRKEAEVKNAFVVVDQENEKGLCFFRKIPGVEEKPFPEWFKRDQEGRVYLEWK